MPRAAVVFGFAALTSCATNAPPQTAAAGCTQDTDCKGDRTCESGTCVAPAPAAEAGAGKPPPLPPHTTLLAKASQYGQFEVAKVDSGDVSGPECQLWFRSPSDRPKLLFTVALCTGDVPGVNSIGRTDRIGKLRFPAASADGEVEFHLFEIAAARLGNAMPESTYWAVVVRPGEIWATPAPFATAELSEAAMMPGDALPRLLVMDPPTTTKPGQKFEISFGSVKATELPVVPSKVVSQKAETLVGKLESGARATDFRPTIMTASGQMDIIDEDGPCKLDALVKARAKVHMKAEITRFSDGRTHVKCLAITR